MVDPTWTPDADAEMKKVPFFVRGVAKKAVVKAAEAEGVTTIDLAFVNRVRAETNARRGS